MHAGGRNSDRGVRHGLEDQHRGHRRRHGASGRPFRVRRDPDLRQSQRQGRAPRLVRAFRHRLRPAGGRSLLPPERLHQRSTFRHRSQYRAPRHRHPGLRRRPPVQRCELQRLPRHHVQQGRCRHAGAGAEADGADPGNRRGATGATAQGDRPDGAPGSGPAAQGDDRTRHRERGSSRAGWHRRPPDRAA